ncbi:hypothetical protein Sfulv_28000 [Streptomyces fulvorobeus]|uniref:Uncharacterized protein n=1 Tax=Streptomyces fulvorobeus TaxID=284028 RepID=A0A7J0C6D1_9ACTN|nr:hypothetical protein [Streptomyces fulvorobeus]GFM97989.1 hypothetical protein Sfulv_28000 [Streptomyces fulvorobeus]
MQASERAEDVLRMYRLARTGGTAELLRRLARRADGWAGLLDSDGTVLHAAAAPGREHSRPRSGKPPRWRRRASPC